MPFRSLPGINTPEANATTPPEDVCGPAGTDCTPKDGVTLSPLGNRLAQSTLDAAAGNTNLKKKRCFHFVKEGLAAEGIQLDGAKAYQAAAQLAKNPKFNEVKVARNQLSELPAGAVVVWNKNPKAKHPHGHISVALGDGREVSDRIRPQTESYRSTFRVFLPEGAAPPVMVAKDLPSANPTRDAGTPARIDTVG